MKKIFGALRASRGFTLLELIIVVIIIGILAAIALPQYAGFTERSRTAEATNMMGSIKLAEAAQAQQTGAPLAVGANPAAAPNFQSLLGIAVPTDGLTDWNYSVGAVSGAGVIPVTFTVTATRNNAPHAPAGGAAAGNTITLIYNGGGVTWGGNHPMRPPVNGY